MSDKQFIEVSYGEVKLTAPYATRKSRRDRIIDWMKFIRSFTINAVVIASILAVILVTGRELFSQPVIVEEINLPKPLTDRGYTGAVAAHRLWDAIREVQENSGTIKHHESLLTETRQLDVVEPGTGMSLQAVRQMLRGLFGLQQTRIAGEIICHERKCENESLALRLRIITADGLTIRSPGLLGHRDVDTYFKEAALMALEAVDPYVVAAYLQNFPDRQAESRRIAMELVAQSHKHAAWAANLIGNLEADKENFESAIIWYDRSVELAVTLGPKNFALAWNGRGNALVSLDRHEEAMEMYRHATNIDSDYAAAWSNWGNALGNLDRHEEAMEKYRRATEVDPNYAYAWFNWGNELGDLGRHEEAIERYRRATEIDPYYVNAWINLGNVYYRLARHEEAIEKYRRVTEIDPNDSSAWNNWAVTLSRGMGLNNGKACDFAKMASEFLSVAGDKSPQWFQDEMAGSSVGQDCP